MEYDFSTKYSIPRSETASVEVSLYDQNDKFICQYTKIEGVPENYIIDDPSGLIWFERPTDIKLDPDTRYYEKVVITDEYGRTLENISRE